MKRVFAISVLSLSFAIASAQLGFVGGFKTFSPSQWNSYFQAQISDEPFPMSGWHVGIDYWFRLKKRRIEFMPEVNFSAFTQGLPEGKMTIRQAGLQFNVAIYPFDLASDCNCPTFSKDGNLITKGFFLELSPGLVLGKNDFESSEPFINVEAGETRSFGGNIGAGLDLGFSDLFTVTPMVRVYHYSSYEWGKENNESNLEGSLRQFFAGIRLRLHFNEFYKARFR